MLAKVQKYLVDIGDFVVSTFESGRHAEAWEFIAEKTQSKLRGPVLWRLYMDICARDKAFATGDKSISKDRTEKKLKQSAN